MILSLLEDVRGVLKDRTGVTVLVQVWSLIFAIIWHI